jgi:hypothetical protein
VACTESTENQGARCSLGRCAGRTHVHRVDGARELHHRLGLQVAAPGFYSSMGRGALALLTRQVTCPSRTASRCSQGFCHQSNTHTRRHKNHLFYTKAFRTDKMFAMSRFRRLLLCLMMLALPLQGFAAASMLFCGMPPAKQATAETTMHAAHHDAKGVNAPNHDHSIHGDGSQLDKPSAGADESSSDRSHKCSVCAACCNVIALTESPATVQVQSLPKADLAEPFVLIHAVASRLPDRPPRA